MSSRVSVSEARATLPELLGRVAAGDEVVLTRHGEPVAVIVRPDRLRSRSGEGMLATAAALDDNMRAARSARLRVRPRVTQQRSRELVADVRTGRERG